MKPIGPIKSTIYLWLSIIGFSIVGYLTMMMVVVPAPRVFDWRAEIEFSVLMGSFFGTGFWATNFVPDKVADNTGWRKWRPLMWAVGLFIMLWIVCFAKHTDMFSFDTISACTFITGFVLLAGWSFGFMRAERSRAVARIAERHKKDLENQNASATVDEHSEIKEDGAIRQPVEKMEVTLRKANALSKSLIEAARARPVVSNVTVSIYAPTTVETEVQSATTKLVSSVSQATALIEAGYAIRDAIGIANATNGVDSLLTEKAKLEAIEKFLTPIVGSKIAYDFDDGDDSTESSIVASQARLDALKERAKTVPTDRYNREESVSVAVSAPELIEQSAAIKRRKIAIADELLVLNMTKKVTLNEKTVSLLTEFKLI